MLTSSNKIIDTSFHDILFQNPDEWFQVVNPPRWFQNPAIWMQFFTKRFYWIYYFRFLLFIASENL